MHEHDTKSKSKSEFFRSLQVRGVSLEDAYHILKIDSKRFITQEELEKKYQERKQQIVRRKINKIRKLEEKIQNYRGNKVSSNEMNKVRKYIGKKNANTAMASTLEATIDRAYETVKQQKQIEFYAWQKSKQFKEEIDKKYKRQILNKGSKAVFIERKDIYPREAEQKPLLTTITPIGTQIELYKKAEIYYKEKGLLPLKETPISQINVYTMKEKQSNGLLKSQYEVLSAPLDIIALQNDKELKNFTLLELFNNRYKNYFPGFYMGDPRRKDGEIVVIFDEAAIYASKLALMENTRKNSIRKEER